VGAARMPEAAAYSWIPFWFPHPAVFVGITRAG
jgi:hypothetical protein